MKKKDKVTFECVECGYQSLKFFGKCPQCDQWNTMAEIRRSFLSPSVNPSQAVLLKDIDKLELNRINTSLGEFDRVLGGGIVPGSVILIGGEPGVGKSTLLLEIASFLGKSNHKILYYSGEESALQIKLRSERLGIEADNIFMIAMGNFSDLEAAVETIHPQFLIIDSIQTIHSEEEPFAVGSVTAVRFITAKIVELGKKNNITVFIIGHINKEGQIAGPKTLEHMVDAVLYFQGELKSDLRVLRVEKNRYGPINEIGLFQMTGKGLNPISDPAWLFIQHRKKPDSGVTLFPTLNGLRSILIEIQALVCDSPFIGNPRRISIGFDNYRMSMLISVIEKKLKIPFYKSDVFLNITSGITIRETAADLAVLSALLSSQKNLILPLDLVIIGEVGLTGEIRPVQLLENRVKESIRQGFKRFIVPESQADLSHLNGGKISIYPVSHIHDFAKLIKSFKTNPVPSETF